MKRGQEHEGMKGGINFKRDERRNRSKRNKDSLIEGDKYKVQKTERKK